MLKFKTIAHRLTASSAVLVSCLAISTSLNAQTAPTQAGLPQTQGSPASTVSAATPNPAAATAEAMSRLPGTETKTKTAVASSDSGVEQVAYLAPAGPQVPQQYTPTYSGYPAGFQPMRQAAVNPAATIAYQQPYGMAQQPMVAAQVANRPMFPPQRPGNAPQRPMYAPQQVIPAAGRPMNQPQARPVAPAVGGAYRPPAARASYANAYMPQAAAPYVDGAGCAPMGQAMPMQSMAPMGQPMGIEMSAPVEGYLPQMAMQPMATAPTDVYGSLWTDSGSDWSGGGCSPAPSGNCCPTGTCRGLCSCDPCAPCAWMRAEVLLGWLSGYDTPPLLVQSPTDTPIDDFSDDRVMFGGETFGKDLRIGGRITGGFWFDACRKLGIQAEAFTLGNDDNEINILSDGDPFISRPFFNTNAGVNSADGQVIALDGVAVGSFRANTSGRFVSAAPALRWNVNCCSDGCGSSQRLDFIGGYRFFQLREGFSSEEVLRPQDGSYAPGTSFTLRDNIDTQNDFHGFELGGVLMQQNGNLTTEFQVLAAFGEMTRLYQLDGSTTLFVPNAIDDTYPGGFLVRPQDIGTHTDSEFTVIPQFRANISYCLSQNVQLTMGYSFVYMKDVFRPGPLMSTAFDGSTLGVDPAAGVAGSALPKSTKTDVFMNALSFGATYNF